MIKNMLPIESVFKKERDQITVPSRDEFRTILATVTDPAKTRNTYQKGIVSPFGSFFRISTKAFVATTIAVVVIVMVIIPKKPLLYKVHTEPVTSTENVLSVNSSAASITDDIISNIMYDITTENNLIDQEFSAEQITDSDNDILDTLIS